MGYSSITHERQSDKIATVNRITDSSYFNAFQSFLIASPVVLLEIQATPSSLFLPCMLAEAASQADSIGIPIFFVSIKSQPNRNRFALPESLPLLDNRRSSTHPHSWSGAFAKERTGILNKKEGNEYVSVLVSSVAF